MNDYRRDMKYVVRESYWTMGKVLPLIVVGAVALGGIGWVIKSATKVGDTAIERVVLENSYQRSAGYEARIATLEANLAEVRRQLASNPSEKIRPVLESQAASLRVQIAAAKAQQ